MSISLLKPAHPVHRERLDMLKTGGFPYPSQVQIDLFNPCQHDCWYCAYRFDKNEDLNALFNLKDWIRYDKMVEILDDCVAMETKGIELTGGGEPTLHKQFGSLVRDLYDRELELGLVSNAQTPFYKSDDNIGLLANAHWVRFSVDAATEMTYRNIHVVDVGAFRETLGNIERLVERKSDKTVVGMSFVICPDNVTEIVAFAKLAKRIGVDNVRFTAAVLPGKPNPHSGHMLYAMKLMEEATQLQDDDFKVYRFDSRMAIGVAYTEYEEGDLCHYSHFNAVIGGDLNLYPCCVWKYRPKGVVASLKEQSFRQAWESEERKQYYADLNIADLCKTCYLKPKNDTIKYLLSDDPQHVNFI